MSSAIARQTRVQFDNARRRAVRARWMLLAHGFLAMVVLPWLYVYQATANDDAEYTRKLCMGFTVASAWLLVSCYILCRDFYHPYFMFLISAIMFNGGQLFLVGTDLMSPDLLMFGQFSRATVNLTVYLIFASLVMVHLGVLGYVGLRSTIARPAPNDELLADSVRNVGYTLMIIGAIPYAAALMGSLVASAQGYEGVYTASSGVVVRAQWVLANLFLPGLLFALASSRKNRSTARILATLALLAMATSLMVGTRSRAMTLGCALLFVWTRSIKRIPAIITVGLIVGFLVIAPTVAMVRDLPMSERLSITGISSAFAGNSNVALAMLSETGMTTTTTALTVDLVPQSRPFGFGLTYANSILLSIPGTGFISASSRVPLVLSDWLIWQADPSAAERNGGFGYSFIAEAYLNFGPILGPVMCGGLGLLIAYFVFRADDPLSVGFIGCLLLTLPMFSRGESVTVTRGLVEQCIPPLVATHYLVYRSQWVKRMRRQLRPSVQ